MFCSACGKALVQGAQFCSDCGSALAPAGVITDKRPIAGIAVAAVLGVIGVVWSILAIFRTLYSAPAGVEAALYEAFPGLVISNYFGTTLGLLGNSVLLIGVLLAFLRHGKGHKTVRISCYSMLAALLLTFALALFFMLSAAAWPTLDPATQGGLIGGVLGGAIGGAVQWGLILFLFRKRRWP